MLADQVGRVGAWVCWRAGGMSAVQVQDLLEQTRWGGWGRGLVGGRGACLLFRFRTCWGRPGGGWAAGEGFWGWRACLERGWADLLRCRSCWHGPGGCKGVSWRRVANGVRICCLTSSPPPPLRRLPASSLMYALPSEYQVLGDEPLRIMVLGWGEQHFMQQLLRVMDRAPGGRGRAGALACLHGRRPGGGGGGPWGVNKRMSAFLAVSQARNALSARTHTQPPRLPHAPPCPAPPPRPHTHTLLFPHPCRLPVPAHQQPGGVCQHPRPRAQPERRAARHLPQPHRRVPHPGGPAETIAAGHAGRGILQVSCEYGGGGGAQHWFVHRRRGKVGLYLDAVVCVSVRMERQERQVL